MEGFEKHASFNCLYNYYAWANGEEIVEVAKLITNYPMSIEPVKISTEEDKLQAAKVLAGNMIAPNKTFKDLEPYEIREIKQAEKDTLRQLFNGRNGNRDIYHISTNEEELAKDAFRAISKALATVKEREYMQISKKYAIRANEISEVAKPDPDTEPVSMEL
jgi:Na+-transporting NADH:ubiquinone oxidoreductase subunit NqrA